MDITWISIFIGVCIGIACYHFLRERADFLEWCKKQEERHELIISFIGYLLLTFVSIIILSILMIGLDDLL